MDMNERQVILSIVRAEAAAQSKIMVKDVAQQFNLIHKSDADTISTMAGQLNKLGVMMEVVIDLLADGRPLQSEGLASDKRKKFSALCDAKAKSYAESHK